MLIKVTYKYTTVDKIPRIVRLLVHSSDRKRAEELACLYHKKHHPDEMKDLHILSCKIDFSFDNVINVDDVDLVDLPFKN